MSSILSKCVIFISMTMAVLLAPFPSPPARVPSGGAPVSLTYSVSEYFWRFIHHVAFNSEELLAATLAGASC